jgi:hypothetical protein
MTLSDCAPLVSSQPREVACRSSFQHRAEALVGIVGAGCWNQDLLTIAERTLGFHEARALLLAVGIPAETDGIGRLVVLPLGHVLRTAVVKAKHFVVHVLP